MTYLWRTLLHRKMRTALSLLGVGIGVATIVALWSVAEGYQSSFVGYLHDSGAQLMAYQHNAADLLLSRVPDDVVRRLQDDPAVAHVSRANFTFERAPTPDVPMLFLFGRYPGDRIMEKYREGLVEGDLLSSPDEIMVGVIASELLGWKLGDEIQLFEGQPPFRVCGIFSSRTPWESAGAIVHARAIQERLRAGDSHSLLFIYLEDGADPDAQRLALAGRFPELTITPGENFLDAFTQLDYVDQFIWIVSMVAVLVGGLGVLNTMMMSISERTREIGTLRALGWSSRRILGVVLTEGLVLSVVGGVLGLGLGVVGAESLLAWYPKGFIVASYVWPTFVRALMVAVLLGIAGAFYPAWRASRLSPAVALRYE